RFPYTTLFRSERTQHGGEHEGDDHDGEWCTLHCRGECTHDGFQGRLLERQVESAPKVTHRHEMCGIVSAPPEPSTDVRECGDEAVILLVASDRHPNPVAPESANDYPGLDVVRARVGCLGAEPDEVGLAVGVLDPPIIERIEQESTAP